MPPQRLGQTHLVSTGAGVFHKDGSCLSTVRQCPIQYDVEVYFYREGLALSVLRIARHDTDRFVRQVNVFWPERNQLLSSKAGEQSSLHETSQSGRIDSHNHGLFLFAQKAGLCADRLERFDSFSGMRWLAPVLCFLQEDLKCGQFHIHAGRSESCLFASFLYCSKCQAVSSLSRFVLKNVSNR
jgi:hypothetical protein